MKTNEQLINNIIGQLNGIKKMINEKKDCFDVIAQMKAVRSATTSLMNKFIEINFISCINPSEEKNKKENIKKLLIELNKD